MRFRVGWAWMLLAIASVSLAPRNADAQAGDASKARPELAFGYSYVRSNAPPGGCTCFNQNGGNATFAWPLKKPEFAVAGDVTVTHASGIASRGYGLTMSAYTVGVRYEPKITHSAIRPFGQVLVGLGHASGTLVNGSGTSVGNAGAAFASILGGGVDWRLKKRWSIRLVEGDYLLTTFDNGANNHQNNLRINTGLVVRF